MIEDKLTNKELTAMNDLRGQALRSAYSRGHDMKRFWHMTPKIWTSDCKRCGADVTIILNPLPNQIDVGGEAVAVGCPR